MAKDYFLEKRLIASQIASIMQSFFSFITNLLVKIILARLLFPEDFGLFALASLLFLVMDTIRELGIGNNIIRLKEEIYYGNAILINIISSLSWIAIVVFFGNLFSKIDPRLPAVIRIYIFLTIINSLTQLIGVYLRKNLLLAKGIIPRAITAILYLMIAVILAKMNFGVFSLIYAQIISSSVLTILLWYIFIKNIKIEFTFKFTKKLLKTSKYFLGLGILFAILPHLDYGILGMIAPAAEIGHYFMALSLVTICYKYITPLFYNYIFPLFAKLQDDVDSLYEYYKLITIVSMMLIVPLCAFLFFKSEDVILLLYGRRWLPAAFILKALALWPILTPHTLFGDDIINIRNEKITFYSYSFYFVCFVITGYIFSIKMGIIGCVVAKYISDILASLPRLFKLYDIFYRHDIFFKEYIIIYFIPFLIFSIFKGGIFSGIAAFLASYFLYSIIFRKKIAQIHNIIMKNLSNGNINREFLIYNTSNA